MEELDVPRPPVAARTTAPRGRRWYGAAAGVVALALVAGAIVGTRDSGSRASLRAIDTEPEIVTEEVVPSSLPTLTGAPTVSATAVPLPTATSLPSASAVATMPDAPTGAPTHVPTALPTVPVVVPTTQPPAAPLVSLSVSDDSLPTATKMVLTVRWRNEPGRYVQVDTRDGHPVMTSDPCYHGDRDSTVSYGPEWAVATYEWSYRKAGTYDIVAELLQYPCSGGGSITSLGKSVPRRVLVTPGADVANGPWLPHLSLSATLDAPENATQPVPPERLWYYVGTRDSDGWLWKIAIDFGDGTEPHVMHSHFEDCSAGDDHGGKKPFPDTTWPWGGHGGGNGWHDLPGPGTYTVTATAYSANCDGGDVQSVTRRVTVVVPG